MKGKHMIRIAFYCLTFQLIWAARFNFAQTLDKSALDTLLRNAAQTHSEAVIIYHDQKLIVEKYFGIGKSDVKIEAMSATKSIVGLAVACMLSDGLIDSLGIPVCKFYPEWKQGQKQWITIRHLLTHTSGIQNNPNATVEIYPSRDFVQLALAAELSAAPGTVFSYNNKALNLMAGVIQKIAHKRMDIYIGERLFKPLGITDFSWSLDSAGNPHVMSGCQIRPADFAKIGLLLLGKGSYNNRQVISSNAIDQVTKPCDLYAGYGLLWWLDYDQTLSIIDDSIIEPMEKAQLDTAFIEKMKSIKGMYKSDQEFFKKLVEKFGPNPREIIRSALGSKKIEIRKLKVDGPVTFRADGYLGNFIIVDPVKKLVAVRMISGESFKGEEDNFIGFEKLVKALVK